jgi:hypothetical protein
MEDLSIFWISKFLVAELSTYAKSPADGPRIRSRRMLKPAIPICHSGGIKVTIRDCWHIVRLAGTGKRLFKLCVDCFSNLLKGAQIRETFAGLRFSAALAFV